MKSSTKMLQNLLHIFYIYENPKLLFPFFISCYFNYPPNECPCLCRHRPGHSLGEKIKQHEMKNGNSNFEFSFVNIIAHFEAFHWNFSSSTNPQFGRSDFSLNCAHKFQHCHFIISLLNHFGSVKLKKPMQNT